MKAQVLLSCMFSDYEIVKKSNLENVPTLIVNQCDSMFSIEKTDALHSIYNTPERGLSKSRNMAIRNSNYDICVISDDDEVFINGFLTEIEKIYDTIPDADVIVVKIKNFPEKFRSNSKIKRLTKLDLLKVSSQQITFKRNSVLKNNIWFNELLGAGTGNGAGEENAFLLQCYKKHLRIYYAPIEIAYVKEDSTSTWFRGFDFDYFYDRGATLRYIYGFFFSSLYSFYYLVSKHRLYKGTINFSRAFKANFKGIIEDKIKKEEKRINGEKNNKQ